MIDFEKKKCVCGGNQKALQKEQSLKLKEKFNKKIEKQKSDDS